MGPIHVGFAAILISTSAWAQRFEVRLIDQAGSFSTDGGRRVIRGGAAVGHGAPGAAGAQPVQWDASGTPVLLPLLAGDDAGEAIGLNASGMVVGSSIDVVHLGHLVQYYSRAVAWQAGAVVDLSQQIVVGPQYDLQTSMDVSSAGRIIGLGYDPSTSRTRAWMLDGGTLVDLGSLAPAGTLFPFDINDAHRVAGYAETIAGRNHAILWDNGVVHDLHVSGGVLGVSSRAFGLDEAGNVVGTADFDARGTELERAALWPATGGVIDLGTLGGAESWAHAINLRGDIVGSAYTAASAVAATLWRGGAIHDLNHSIAADSGWYLLEARGIADDGRIVGTGVFQGAEHGYQLVPQCESCATHCVAAPNSTGQRALLSTTGWESVSAGFFELHAGPVQPGVAGQFFCGTQAVQAPFGNGFRCVGGSVFRLPATAASASGRLTSVVDFQSPTLPSALFQPGTTWQFQAFYRDPAAGGASFNLSNGMSVSFVP